MKTAPPNIGDKGAINRVFRILGTFHHDFPSGSAKEIAQRTNIPDSSAFRLLARLHQAGILWHEPETGQYGPGLRFIELGDVALRQLRIPAGIQGVLRELQAETDEDASFSVWRGGPTRTCVAVSPSRHALREFMTIGQTHPLWLDASGKAIAAHLPPAGLSEVVAAAVNDGLDAATFTAELAEIQRSGMAITEGARVPGVMAISVPVRSADVLIGSITVSGPAFRISNRVTTLASAVNLAAQQLGQELARLRGRATQPGA